VLGGEANAPPPFKKYRALFRGRKPRPPSFKALKREGFMATVEDAMRRVPPAVIKSIKVLDGLSIWTGKTIAWLVIPMVVALIYEVVMRYWFRAPTIWALDVAVIAFGIHFMVASAYCLQQGLHIRADFLLNMCSIRKRAVIDMLNYVIFFFPVNFLFLYVGWNYAYRSFEILERSIFSPWMPWIWPVKMAIPVMVFLSILQGVSEFMKCYYRWKLNAELWPVVPDDGSAPTPTSEPVSEPGAVDNGHNI
jgi:TRAP-type mannitol/chloroaromatic compound transport system permease small subunit